MTFKKATSEVYCPGGEPAVEALSRTTHLAIAAHQDDIEIMAMAGILECFGQPDKWFTGCVVTDGAGSPRDGIYGRYTDSEMMAVRRVEQKKAAFIGEYAAQVFLDYPSKEIKNPAEAGPKEDLRNLLSACRAETVYLHNLCDKHDTHVAVSLRAIAAIRELPAEHRPKRLYGCEVWRDLDWLADSDKVVFNCDGHENLAAALLGVFDSQIAGGKRYDLATLGRRRAHATYHQSHSVDAAQLINFGMDLTPLVIDTGIDPIEFACEHVRRLERDVRERISKLA
jgi:LmbE family N-acetylglucosaminyl deacetylase